MSVASAQHHDTGWLPFATCSQFNVRDDELFIALDRPTRDLPK